MDRDNAIAASRRKWDKITLLSILTLFVAAVFLICTLTLGSQADSQMLFYPVFSFVNPLWNMLFVVLCGLIPLMVILTGYFSFEHLVNPQDYPERYHLELLGVLAAALILLIGFFRLFDIADLTHIDTVHLAGNRYILAERHTFDDLGFGTYILYECPESGNVCTRIYDDDGEHMARNISPQLVSDQELNAVSIIVNGETIYSHTAQ